ncbi:MAG: hypothetical protein QNK03_21920 [Myxococcota bacterium]|nr:hypothetical protein [Myxococcota bacterium]
MSESGPTRMYPGMSPDERTTFAPYSAFDIPADLRRLHGRYDVESTARRVRNFRYAEEWMMMMLGGWMATIPEVPVKTGLGKICWECAQAADALGKRLPELRCGRKAVQASESSNSGFADFVQAVAEPESPDQTIEKLVGVFDVLKPHLIETYERTARETDQICDAPTIELLEDIVRKARRHVAWGQEVLDRLCDTDALRERRRRRAAELEKQLQGCGGVTGDLGELHVRTDA